MNFYETTLGKFNPLEMTIKFLEIKHASSNEETLAKMAEWFHVATLPVIVVDSNEYHVLPSKLVDISFTDR